jgi:inner membrane protein YidH
LRRLSKITPSVRAGGATRTTFEKGKYLMAEQSVAKNSFLDRLRSLLRTSTHAPEQNKRPMDVSTRLAYDRTFLAHERTLMAWVRTSSSLITFGFSIYKFFQLERGAGMKFASVQVIGPRQFSMILIIIGVVSLVMATVQHRRQVGLLKMEYDTIPASAAGLVAGLVSALGIAAILAVIFRL